jgi:hypothetical protein
VNNGALSEADAAVKEQGNPRQLANTPMHLTVRCAARK